MELFSLKTSPEYSLFSGYLWYQSCVKVTIICLTQHNCSICGCFLSNHDIKVSLWFLFGKIIKNLCALRVLLLFCLVFVSFHSEVKSRNYTISMWLLRTHNLMISQYFMVLLLISVDIRISFCPVHWWPWADWFGNVWLLAQLWPALRMFWH